MEWEGRLGALYKHTHNALVRSLWKLQWQAVSALHNIDTMVLFTVKAEQD